MNQWVEAPVGVGMLAALGVVGLVVTIGSLPSQAQAHRTRRRVGAVPLPASQGIERSWVWPGPTARLSAHGRAMAARWRRPRDDRALPGLLERVAREVRSGASLPAAVAAAQAAVATDDRGRALVAALAHGVPLRVALVEWAGPDPSPARHLAATALVVAAETGGASAGVIDGVAETLRDRVALEREVAALSSQARASAALLVVAPVVVALLAASADPRIAAFLFASPAGWACIVVGVVLDAVGAAWMRAIVARAT